MKKAVNEPLRILLCDYLVTMATRKEIVNLEQRLEAAMEMKLDAMDRCDQALERLQETVQKFNRTTDRLEQACDKVQSLQDKIKVVNDYSQSIIRRRKMNLAKATAREVVRKLEDLAQDKYVSKRENSDDVKDDASTEADKSIAGAGVADGGSADENTRGARPDGKPRTRRKRGRSKSKRDRSIGNIPGSEVQRGHSLEQQKELNLRESSKSNPLQGDIPTDLKGIVACTSKDQASPALSVPCSFPVAGKPPLPMKSQSLPLATEAQESLASSSPIMPLVPEARKTPTGQASSGSNVNIERRADDTRVYINKLSDRLARAQSRTVQAETAICCLQLEINRLGLGLLQNNDQNP